MNLLHAYLRIGLLLLCFALAVMGSRCAWGQLRLKSDPINYGSAAESNRVAELQERIASGDVTLEFDAEHGYLKSVLDYLDVPVSSQMLVFSKTSFQLRKITPERPRALYFNDDVYIGWVQGGDVVEVSTADRELGAVFYTLDQQESPTPRFERDDGLCMTCHASSRTNGVPGHFVRSVFTNHSGRPFYEAGTFTTDHRSPFLERWGGWYVSGTHGRQRHMGNVALDDSDDPEQFDTEPGANLTDLSSLLDVSPYLAPGSDIVALMVLEHQTQTQNAITRAAFETRSALHNDEVMNQALDRTDGFRSDSATRRIEKVGDMLVDYLLFVDEFPLEDRVAGTSDFAAEFATRGPFDSRGRSLRQFDLTQRMLKYPCSYLIYSEPFDHLPQPVKEYVYRRLHGILTGVASDDRYVHLTPSLRTAILEILRETKHDLPDYWRTGA